MNKPFPLHVLPSPLAEYVAEGADALDCDVSYIAVPLLPVVAAAIGNSRRISLKKSWSEPAIIWAAIVGESGTAKSPAFDLATRPLWRRQSALLKEYSAARQEYESELETWKNTPKADRVGEKPSPPTPCQHPLVSEITIEALADRLLATPRGTCGAYEEMSGWFGLFNKYSNGGGDVAHWLSLFGGRAMKIDRKTGDRPTTYVENASVSLCGTIQPATLRRQLLPEFFENGLASRLLVAAPEPRAKKWTDAEISDETMNAIDGLFNKLFALQQVPGPHGDAPMLVELDYAAKALWIDFVNTHNDAMQDMAGPVRSAWAKLEGYAARFALVRHCVRTASGEKEQMTIDESDIAAGIELSRWFGEETTRVYRSSTESKEDRDRRELVDLVCKLGGTVSARDVRQHARRRFPTSENAELALQALVDAADGCWEQPPRSNTGRPRDRVFVLADLPTDNFQSPESRRKPETPKINGNSHFAAGDALETGVL